jgi:hypothetical protein
MAEKKYAGRDLRIHVSDKTFFHATECGFNSSKAIEAIATKDTNGEEAIASTLTFTLTTSALVTNKPTSSTTTNGTIDILNIHKAGTRVPFEFTTGDEGDILISGECLIESCDITAPVAGFATYSVNLKGVGEYTVEAVEA